MTTPLEPRNRSTSRRWNTVATMARNGTLVENLRMTELMAGPRARRGSLFSAVPKPEGADGPETDCGKTIVYTKLVGAILFLVGSVAFIFQGESLAWLYYSRLGCICWIPGCIAYLSVPWLLSIHGNTSLSGKMSDSLQSFAMVVFLFGSVLYFIGDEATVKSRLGFINRVFLFGSILIFADAIKTTSSAMLTTGFSSDNALDLATTAFFMTAAVMGGSFYGNTPVYIMEGLYCWFIGSALCMIGPIVELRRQSSPQNVRISQPAASALQRSPCVNAAYGGAQLSARGSRSAEMA